MKEKPFQSVAALCAAGIAALATNAQMAGAELAPQFRWKPIPVPKWKTQGGAKIENGVLTVSRPEPGTAYAEAELDLSEYDGKAVELSLVRWPEGRYSPDCFLGVCFRFHNVEDFVLRGATISRLVLRDCEQINRTGRPMRFLHNRGEIGELVHENTRLVSAPGENILVDTETPIPPYARDWATMADIVARGMAHPASGAKRPDSDVAAGFGEGMIRVFPFVGEDANAFAGKIDEYGFTVQPGVCWCRYKNFPMRIEATASRATAWFRIRFPETGARSILADSALSVAFSEPVVAKEASGENTIYRFAPGGRPIVVQASRGSLAESETDFDRVANLARRAWNDVCR